MCSKQKTKTKPQRKTLMITEKSNLPDKEFRITVIKMLTELGKIMDEHNGNFNKVI